jgi:murein DD-endopeptidase MepM/ murein hydrolase activator NlpD
MHLLNYLVQNGQWVKAGQIIGHVGDTGIRISFPHLHFQLRDSGEIIDPLVHLRAYLIGPQATYRGEAIIAAMPRRWREARSHLRALARSRREVGESSAATDEVVSEPSGSKDSNAGN